MTHTRVKRKRRRIGWSFERWEEKLSRRLVVHPGGCWEWLGDPFSETWYRSSRTTALRACFTVFNRVVIGKNRTLVRLCGSVWCVNPDHHRVGCMWVQLLPKRFTAGWHRKLKTGRFHRLNVHIFASRVAALPEWQPYLKRRHLLRCARLLRKSLRLKGITRR